MENYRTEEEQVAALQRWWKENGRSLLVAVVIALAAGFGWQGWQSHQLRQQEQASDIYQAMLRAIGTREAPAGSPTGIELAEQLKRDFGNSTYAQFAALHLAAIAVKDGKLSDAEAQLRWVLGKAPNGSDVAQIAQLRLARVLAASGSADQALAILQKAESGPYSGSYAAARGDILLLAGRKDEARDAYSQALALAGGPENAQNLPALQQKLQNLTPVPPRTLEAPASAGPDTVETAPAPGDTADPREK